MTTAKPITGQYECEHRSSLGLGLDYYTARLDRLTLQQSGRFVLIVQEKSRVAQAAKTLMQGQQPSMTASETRREGTFVLLGNQVTLRFDDGGQEQGQVSWNGDGIQIGPDYFTKVSDSTMLPPTHRVKKDMQDIARGLKIAGTVGGIAMKAAKELQGVLQPAQEPAPQNTTQAPPVQSQAPSQRAQPAHQPPVQPQAPSQHTQPAYQPPVQQRSQPEALFCDQCGARARPGKKFCSQCGADLP